MLPYFIKKKINKIIFETRVLNQYFGKLPDFIIIGAQKCGTTSLFEYMLKNPFVKGAFTKEVHYFDINYNKGIGWYRKHFPILKKQDVKTGESTPYYMFHPHTVNRVSAILPNVKIIIILRNPIDRAWSHYWHEVRYGREDKPFLEAIQLESERIAYDKKMLSKDSVYLPYNHIHFSYISRGMYSVQIERWKKEFSDDQIKIITSEELFQDPQKLLDDLFQFLCIPNVRFERFKIHNKNVKPPMDQKSRIFLKDVYEEEINNMKSILKRNLEWN